MAFDLRIIADTAHTYYQARGDWPRDDDLLRWNERIDLEPATELYLTSFESSPAGPLDRFGHPVVYIPPECGSPTGTMPIVRSIGANGIDEHGEGDDLTLGRPVNPGSYGRPTTDAFVVFSAVSMGLLALVISVWWVRHRGFQASMLIAIGAWIGLSFIIGSHLLWPARSCCGGLHSPAREVGEVGGILFSLSCLSAIVSLMVSHVREGIAFERQASRIHHGQCPACGYDLNGLQDRGCPECGHLHPESATPPPPPNPETP